MSIGVLFIVKLCLSTYCSLLSCVSVSYTHLDVYKRQALMVLYGRPLFHLPSALISEISLWFLAVLILTRWPYIYYIFFFIFNFYLCYFTSMWGFNMDEIKEGRRMWWLPSEGKNLQPHQSLSWGEGQKEEINVYSFTVTRILYNSMR